MKDRREAQTADDQPETFTLDDFRDDLSEALDAERGDVPDYDQMEVYRTQPVRQYARRAR